MRVVTLNTWKNEGDYPRRLRLMRDGLAALEPDAVCLQECFAAKGFDTAGWLAAELDLVAYAAPARAKLRQHDGRNLQSTSGLATLVRGAAISSQRALPSNPADGERIAQRVDISVDGRPLRLLNLHLAHLRDAAELRALQLARALAWAGDGLLGGLVVAGDLNATAAEAALGPLGLSPRPGTLQGPRADEARPRAAAIDHCVLLRPGGWREVAILRGLDTPDTDGWYPSDHAAVGIELT